MYITILNKSPLYLAMACLWHVRRISLCSDKDAIARECLKFLNLVLFFKLILLVFFTPNVEANIKRWDGGFEAIFNNVYPGRMYDEVLSPVMDKILGECLYACMLHLQCQSINYNEKLNLCELIGRAFDAEFADSETSAGWLNFGTTQGVSAKALDGAWSNWGASIPCLDCKYGNHTMRERKCDSPTPQHGGNKCLKSDNITRSLMERDTENCFKCNITQAPISCNLKKDRNIKGRKIGLKEFKTDQECISYCIELTKDDPNVTHLVINRKPRDLIKCSCVDGILGSSNSEKKHDFCVLQGPQQALNKPTNQSSTHHVHVSEKGNDGDARTTAIMNKGTSHWWSVDLETIIKIRFIVIKLYAGVSDYRKMQVNTKKSSFSPWNLCNHIGIPKTSWFKVVCNNAESRYAKVVRISNEGKALRISEVYIYG